MAELEAVKDKVLEELQYLRSLDTGGDGTHTHSYTEVFSSFGWKINWILGFVLENLRASSRLYNNKHCLLFIFSLSTLTDINFIKNQINSLLFVKKVCETRIQRLQSGKVNQSLLFHSHLPSYNTWIFIKTFIFAFLLNKDQFSINNSVIETWNNSS